MGTKRWIAALLAIWLGANVGECQAKPPDLPDDAAVRCQETEPGQLRLEWDASGLARVEEIHDGAAEAPICLDAWSARLLPILAQRFCERILAILQPTATEADEPRPQPATVTPARDAAADDAARSKVDPVFAATAEKARLLYELASRCAREGKLAEARAHLREAHLANPTCRFGRLAIQRLQEMEALPIGEESSEPAPPKASRAPMTQTSWPAEEPQSDDDAMGPAERAYRRVREITQPLGLVPAQTY